MTDDPIGTPCRLWVRRAEWRELRPPWTEAVPGVDRVEIERAGHVLFVDRPKRVLGLVREFGLGID